MNTTLTLSREEKKDFTLRLIQPAHLDRMNPTHLKKWDEWVMNSPGGSFFHTSNWAKVLMESYGYAPQYLADVAEDRFNVLLPVMEVNSRLTGKRGVSLPFSDYCEPIVDKSINRASILRQVSTVGRRLNWSYLELRGDGVTPEHVFPYTYFYRHELKLEAEATDNFKNFRRNYRSKIRKAVKNGVKVEVLKTEAAVEAYYKLHCMARKDKGLPPQPLRFFKKIYEHIIAQGMGFVVLATYEDEVIAGSMYFQFGDQIIYKYGATNPAFFKLQASYLVMWEAIRHSCEIGCKSFCFGKTDAAHTGLVQFKDGWGSEKTRLNYYKYDLKTMTFIETDEASSEAGYTVFKKMPMPLLKAAGSFLYKHVA